MNNQIRVLIADANEGFTAQLSGFLGENSAFVVAGVVLEERDEHSGGRDAGIVERMRKIRLAVFTLDADAKPSRLRVAEV